MVSRKEDKIDFNKLERDLNNAVEMDNRYWRENDAKFRAVNQKVANYDEFRDIVLAAHIKPLKKGDKISDGVVFQQPWNVSASKKKESEQSNQSTSAKAQEGRKLPKNGHEFTLQWRRHCKTPTDKCAYLLLLGADHMRNIFKTEISFGLLGDLCSALISYTDRSQAETVLDILDALSTVNRFDLSLSFLSETERQSIKELFSKLEVDSENEANKVKLSRLRNVYLS